MNHNPSRSAIDQPSVRRALSGLAALARADSALHAAYAMMARRILVSLGLVLAGLVIAVVTVWGALVVFYLAPGPEPLRKAFAWGFAVLGLATIVALAVRRIRQPAFAAYTVALVLVAAA